MTATVSWQAKRYADLSLDELYELLRLRSQVFVIEQNCVYLDPDDKDRHPEAVHLMGRAADGRLAAYLRILPPGLSYPQVSFGRVLTAAEFRGQRLGGPLLEAALIEIQRRWPGADIQICALSPLRTYYGRHGFETSSEPYVEDGIPHIDLLRRGRGAA